MPVRADAALPLRFPPSLEPAITRRLVSLAAALPLAGAPIRISLAPELHICRGRLRSGPGPGTAVHAASFIRARKMVLEPELCGQPDELARIFTHELFHFAWPRLGNPRRRRWEQLLLEERREHARGETGWSSEWRKEALAGRKLNVHSRLWREYLAESFCDSGARCYSGVESHPEFTLAPRFLLRRRRWLRFELSVPLTI